MIVDYKDITYTQHGTIDLIFEHDKQCVFDEYLWNIAPGSRLHDCKRQAKFVNEFMLNKYWTVNTESRTYIMDVPPEYNISLLMNQGEYEHAVKGLALDSNGVWHTHYWCVDKNDLVIETHTLYLAYLSFGYHKVALLRLSQSEPIIGNIMIICSIFGKKDQEPKFYQCFENTQAEAQKTMKKLLQENGLPHAARQLTLRGSQTEFISFTYPLKKGKLDHVCVVHIKQIPGVIAEADQSSSNESNTAEEHEELWLLIHKQYFEKVCKKLQIYYACGLFDPCEFPKVTLTSDDKFKIWKIKNFAAVCDLPPLPPHFYDILKTILCNLQSVNSMVKMDIVTDWLTHTTV